MNLKHGRHSVYALNVHLIFVCKRRGKVYNLVISRQMRIAQRHLRRDSRTVAAASVIVPPGPAAIAMAGADTLDPGSAAASPPSWFFPEHPRYGKDRDDRNQSDGDPASVHSLFSNDRDGIPRRGME